MPVFTLAPPLALAAGNAAEHAAFLEYALRRLVEETPLESAELDGWETQLYLLDRAAGLIDTPLRRLHVELMEGLRARLEPARSASQERSRKLRLAERELLELSQEATDETARRLATVGASAGSIFRALQLLARGVYPPSDERQLRASTIQALSLGKPVGELEALLARLAAHAKWGEQDPRWAEKVAVGIGSSGLDVSEQLCRTAFDVSHALRRVLWAGPLRRAEKDFEAALEYFVAGPVRVQVGPHAAVWSSHIDEQMLDDLIEFADTHREEDFVRIARRFSEERLETLSPDAVLHLMLNEDLAWQEREQTLALLLGAGNSYLPALKDRSRALGGLDDEASSA